LDAVHHKTLRIERPAGEGFVVYILKGQIGFLIKWDRSRAGQYKAIRKQTGRLLQVSIFPCSIQIPGDFGITHDASPFRNLANLFVKSDSSWETFRRGGTMSLITIFNYAKIQVLKEALN
jgi:hypothetical protein